jgi:PKD repeat protein
MKPKILFLTFIAIFFMAMIIVPLASADNVNVTPNTTPYITIDPIGNQTIDEVFFINGTTNLPANSEPLLLDIYTSNMNPGGAGSAFSSNVSIQPGETGINFWSCNVTSSLWETFGPGIQQIPIPDAEPGQYIVEVNAFTEPVVATQLFSLLPSERKITPLLTVPVAAFGFFGNRTTEPYDMAPLTVQFVDTSVNSPTSWFWSFGDGSSSTLQNPSHTYTAAGTYTVTLTVTNAAGSNTTFTKFDIITTDYGLASVTSTSIFPPNASPVASFEYITTGASEIAPLTVAFFDTSVNSPTSWFWSFGDGSTSPSQNPSHAYTSAGSYTVTLTAINAVGSNTSSEPLLFTASEVNYSTSTTILTTPSNVAITVASTTWQDTPLPVILSVIAVFAVILIVKLRDN